jgi:hypothetical protein
MRALRAIAPYVRRPGRSAHGHARCELCGGAIAGEHRHLVDVVERTLRCCCGACAFLFQAPGQRYRAAPDRWLADLNGDLDSGVGESVWSALQIPVRIAFFFRHSGLGRWVAFYPGPAGATESLLGLEAWQELAAACPLTTLVEPDVEALLVAGDGHGRFSCFLVPIAACYELVGRVKRSWRGFDGGEAAWREIDAFFAAVRARTSPLASAEAR